MTEKLYNEILGKVARYMKALENVGFANYELMKIGRIPQNRDELLNALDIIFDSSKELNYIIEEAPNSFFVCDSHAVCIRVNKSFEKMVKIMKNDILGVNMSDKDADGSFRPSVCHLTLKEKRPVSVLQEIGDVKNMAVTGVPVYDENGDLFRIITNAVKIDEVEPIAEYLNKKQHENNAVAERKTIIAKSDAMKQIVELADVVKDTESNILITGETGVGKGVLARYIHETSVRSENPMVSINCGAIPENLLESELFGYESGAFTGADRKGKPGLIELAEGGTLFLDEISELPLMLQVKILYFLQTKKIMRVGGTKEIHIDARVIAASNKQLEAEVQKGTFRSDLYYRINVIPIHIPPLRDRKEDLYAMAEFFLEFYSEKYNKKTMLTREYIKYIREHGWPGNVRELENYIERMVVTSDSCCFSVLNEGWDDGHEKTGNENAGKQDLIKRIEKTERDAVIEAYMKYKSSYKVAEALGISQSTAYRRIKKFIKDEQK